MRRLILLVFLLSLSSSGLINSQSYAITNMNITNKTSTSNASNSTLVEFTNSKIVNLNETLVNETNTTTKLVIVEVEEDEKSGVWEWAKTFVSYLTSIDRYTLIMTCAFIFGLMLISLLIFIAICICKKFDKSPRKQNGEQIAMVNINNHNRHKSPKKPKTKIDFLDDESKAFVPKKSDPNDQDADTIRSFSTASGKSKRDSHGSEATIKNDDNDDVKNRSAQAENRDVDDDDDDDENELKQSLLPDSVTPKRSDIKSPTSVVNQVVVVNETTPASHLNQSQTSINNKNKFTKNRQSSTKDVSTSYRQSLSNILSSKISKRWSSNTSQNSLYSPKETQLDFRPVGEAIDKFVNYTDEVAQSTTSINRSITGKKPIDSRANSVTDIYIKAIEEKRKNEMERKLKNINHNSVSTNPIGANSSRSRPDLDSKSFISGSEKSAY